VEGAGSGVTDTEHLTLTFTFFFLFFLSFILDAVLWPSFSFTKEGQ
jgi:hypothetical protein